MEGPRGPVAPFGWHLARRERHHQHASNSHRLRRDRGKREPEDGPVIEVEGDGQLGTHPLARDGRDAEDVERCGVEHDVLTGSHRDQSAIRDRRARFDRSLCPHAGAECAPSPRELGNGVTSCGIDGIRTSSSGYSRSTLARMIASVVVTLRFAPRTFSSTTRRHMSTQRGSAQRAPAPTISS